MNRFVLACVLVFVPAVTARAGFTSEGAFAFAARVSTNTNSPMPTYSLQTTSPGGGLSPLAVSVDGRSAGSFADSALKFALASVVPAGQSIISAVLTFNVQGSQVVANSNPILTVSGFAADGNAVSLADFSLATTTLGSTPALGNTGFGIATLPAFSFNVTSYLQLLQTSGATAAGFRFDDTGGNVYINAPNDATASLQPTLSITYAAAVPEPASAALASVGLMLSLVVARRRRAVGPGIAA